MCFRTNISGPLILPWLHSSRVIRLPLLSSSFETSKPFTLYTSPPRTEYKEDDAKLSKSKLGDMGWGAAAIVQVRFHGEQAVLKEESKSQAKVLEPPSMGMSGDQQQQQEKNAPSGGRTLGGGTGNAEKKVPKWFKGFSEFDDRNDVVRVVRII